jgi:predicted RNase H-like HicB family nuclease
MLGLLLTDDAQVAGGVRGTVCDVQATEIEFVFEPDPDGGYHAYAPELPGLHTQGDTLEEAVSNAEEALALYVQGLREEGRTLDMGVVRRTLSLPA